jgi:hypothetical protein
MGLCRGGDDGPGDIVAGVSSSSSSLEHVLRIAISISVTMTSQLMYIRQDILLTLLSDKR